MPIGATAGFDVLFAISARTFGSLIEGIVRPAVFALGPPIPVLGGTLNFDDMRLEAWFGTTTGNTVEIRLGLHNASFTAAGNPTPVSFGANWSDFFVPAVIASGPAGAGVVDLTLTFNFGQTQFDADDEVPLQTAGFNEPLIASLLGPALVVGGFTNPTSLTGGTGISIVLPVTTVAPAGTFPSASIVSVAVQRRPTGATPGEEAVAILLTFQNRPNTPAVVAPGNPAALPPSGFGGGQDLLLNINNRFLFELLASLSLEAPTASGGLGVPVGSVAATAAGVTLVAPAAVTLGGTAGTLTVFTLGAPAAGTTTLPLAVTFVFVLDFITYTVAIVGATLTVGMTSGGNIVIGSAIPPATVTTMVPFWLVVIRILAGIALGLLTGNIVIVITAAIVGGLSVIVETTIVSAIAGPSAVAGITGATGGLGGGLIPPAIAALAGGGTLSPPLVFDDLQAGGRSTLADPIKVVRRKPAVELHSGRTIDLDSGKVEATHGIGLGGARGKADLNWDDTFGLNAVGSACMVTMGGRFSTIAYADVASAISAGSSSTLAIGSVPLVSPEDLTAGNLPAGLLLGVITNRGRLAKVLAWRDVEGRLVLRYQLWDASEASIRIVPAEPFWSLTTTRRTADTPATEDEPVMHHSLSGHKTQLTALTHRMAGPITFSWTLDGMPLSGNGTAEISGAEVIWSANGSKLTLETAVGASLDHARLVCDATDANGVRTSDSAQLSVSGQTDYPASPFEGALAGMHEKVRDAMKRWVDQPVIGDPLPPDPAPFRRVEIGAEARIRTAIRVVDATINVGAIQIR